MDLCTYKSPFMKKLLILFALTCILFGCNKSSTEDEYYTINGVVLDYDSQLPIAGAKVRSLTTCSPACPPTDSAITDVFGKVSFRFKINDVYEILLAEKANYIGQNEKGFLSYTNITTPDTIYLARPSFVNVTVHKTGTYLPTDIIKVQLYGDALSLGGPGIGYRILHSDNANMPDKQYNLQAVYSHAPGFIPFRHQKIYFIKEIIRNGSVLSSQPDSTNIIQFGTQNFILNY